MKQWQRDRTSLLRFKWRRPKRPGFRFFCRRPHIPIHWAHVGATAEEEVDYYEQRRPRLGFFGDSGFDEYSPLKRTGLFRDFGALNDESMEKMCSFADRWGQLTGRDDWLSLWQREIPLMRECVWLLDHSSEEDVESLPKGARSAGYGDWICDLAYGENADEDPLDLWETAMALTDPDCEQAASLLLERLVNFQFEWHSLRPRVRMHDSAGGEFDLVLEPRDLISALWLQLAQSMTGDREWRKCPQCASFFEVSLEAGGYRKSRVYCTDACRQKAWRKRNPEKRREQDAKKLRKKKAAKSKQA